MSTLKIIDPGIYTSVQDLGRYGYQHYGMPVSGAMDAYSSEFANALLGNNKNDAVLEMTMTGAELQFDVPTIIAITGANMHPKLNGKSVMMFKSIPINANDILSIGQATNGFRTYIAVKGGFLTEMVLGSRSMAKGITSVVRVKKDDVLDIENYSGLFRSKNAKLKFNASIIDTDVFNVTQGPEFDKLSKEQQRLLFTQEFRVSKHNNRMAYQLLPVLKNNLKSILTSPVLPGTVQLTPSGQLIVLMRDAQTTGGYPRILQLTEQSINIISQKTTANRLKMSITKL